MTFRIFPYTVTNNKVYIFKENFVDFDGLERALSSYLKRTRLQQK